MSRPRKGLHPPHTCSLDVGPLGLDQVVEREARRDQLAHPVAQRAVVLDVHGARRPRPPRRTASGRSTTSARPGRPRPGRRAAPSASGATPRRPTDRPAAPRARPRASGRRCRPRTAPPRKPSTRCRTTRRRTEVGTRRPAPAGTAAAGRVAARSPAPGAACRSTGRSPSPRRPGAPASASTAPPGAHLEHPPAGDVARAARRPPRRDPPGPRRSGRRPGSVRARRSSPAPRRPTSAGWRGRSRRPAARRRRRRERVREVTTPIVMQSRSVIRGHRPELRCRARSRRTR